MKKLVTPYIIDVEASGFGPDSYPIEVGLALGDGQRYCSLIRPAEDWVQWSHEAESVHGISRQLLHKKGKSIKEVACELNGLLAGCTVYSDGWVVDDPWLIKLFARAGIDRKFLMYDILTILNERTLEHWHDIKNQVVIESNLKRHRASNDALIVQQTFNRASQMIAAAS